MRRARQLLLILFCLPITAPAMGLGQAALPKGLLALPAYPAPTTVLEDIEGELFRLDDQKGAWVFVHFWASWCGPCIREMPAIQKMARILQPEGLKIALINTAENEDTVFSFLSVHAPELRPLMDYDGQVTEKWQPRGLPATYLVDPRGQVRFQALGGREWDTPPYLSFLRQLMTTQ